MKQHTIPGVYHIGKKLFTKNPSSCKNIKVYGENLRSFKGNQYRSWNPFRSKLAAVLSKKEISLPIDPSSSILYLGAATGTTVSHLADMCTNGYIYAVEPSPVAAKTLMNLVQQRTNIIPIIEDANHSDRYVHMLSTVDYIYQDISQRNQADIFARNAQLFLKPGGAGVIMVKARSIDVGMNPSKAFALVKEQLETQGLAILDSIELGPYEKDHAALFIKSSKK